MTHLYSKTQTQQELFLSNIFDNVEQQNIFIKQINQINITMIDSIGMIENIFKLANISFDFLIEIAIKLNNNILFECAINLIYKNKNKKLIQLDSLILNLILEYSNLEFFAYLNTENLLNCDLAMLVEKIINFGSETILEYIGNENDDKIINLSLFIKILNSRYKYTNKFLEQFMRKINWTNIYNSVHLVNLLVEKNLFNLILVADSLNLTFDDSTLITGLNNSNGIIIGWLLNKNIRFQNNYLWDYSKNFNISKNDNIIQLLQCYQYKIELDEDEYENRDENKDRNKNNFCKIFAC